MSALAQPHFRTADGGRRPSRLSLAFAMFTGCFGAVAVLWVVGLPLSLLSIVAIDGHHETPWLPWRIDGAWAAAAAAGWGCLVCRLTAAFVVGRIERRGVERPDTEWVVIAVAISGYGSMALWTSLGARVVVTVGLGAVIVRGLAFDARGRARPWGWPMSRRTRAMIAGAALLLAVPYAVTHALTSDGGGGTFSTNPVQTRVGRVQTVEIGVAAMRLPISITSEQVTGPGASGTEARWTVLNLDHPLEFADLWQLQHLSKAQLVGVPTASTRLPFEVPAGRTLWISVGVALRNCHRATLNTVEMHYTVLGIPTTASFPIDWPLKLSCSS